MSLDLYFEEPNICPHCNEELKEQEDRVARHNITHNLNRMAKAAGCYELLWRPEELGIKKASELIEPLENALRTLRADPELFKTYNPSNGWGSYETLITFVEEVLKTCREYPNSRLWACR